MLKSRLVLYESRFISEMIDEERFTRWFPDVYLQLNINHLNFIADGRFKSPCTFVKKQLSLYLPRGITSSQRWKPD